MRKEPLHTLISSYRHKSDVRAQRGIRGAGKRSGHRTSAQKKRKEPRQKTPHTAFPSQHAFIPQADLSSSSDVLDFPGPLHFLPGLDVSFADLFDRAWEKLTDEVRNATEEEKEWVKGIVIATHGYVAPFERLSGYDIAVGCKRQNTQSSAYNAERVATLTLCYFLGFVQLLALAANASCLMA
jgi:hypothetical protein